MSGISGISSVSSNYSYGRFASGRAINSAADGAAELSIIEKQESQARGLDVGTRNQQDGIGALNVADGALSGITDSLQRMKELAIQASNGTYTDSDRAAIQEEINQLKDGIAQTVSNTTFNTKNLLDGSNTDMHIAANPDGSGTSLNTGDATLQALGIANFDVRSGNFNIQDLDDALDKVSAQRSSIGAQTNGLEYGINYNTNASLNTVGAQSRLEDLDFPKAISDQKKKDLLNEFSIMMMKRKQEDEQQKNTRMFAGLG